MTEQEKEKITKIFITLVGGVLTNQLRGAALIVLLKNKGIFTIEELKKIENESMRISKERIEQDEDKMLREMKNLLSEL